MTVFQVTDLKQYAYCPRIVFYRYCLPLIRPMTYKMEAGIAAHDRAGGLEQRRTLRAYGLDRGERHFDVELASEELGLRGRVDLVIEVARDGGDSELIPVDYKHSRGKAGRHFERQLAAYGEMLEATWGHPVRRGFLYFIPLRRVREVAITERLRREMRELVAEMRAMVEGERMPGPTRYRRRCVACEFRRFCNDV
ncbi:MAG: CRISPR-associated protein Cas4 [Anaerolineae bacterium]